MKIRQKLTILSVGIIVLLSACQSKKDKSSENLDPNIHEVIVEEVLQGGSYTYLKVSEYDEEFWIATSQAEVKKGGVYYYTNELEMNDFESKELQRTFETIYFVEQISDKPISSASTEETLESVHSQKQTSDKLEISIDPIEGGITIAELFANRDNYSGKVVKVRGQVVKFNPEIMSTNWVHIQDGTDDSGNFDLTITTDAVVTVDDTAIFEGRVSLNKDFGAGYKYDVILEGGKLISE